MHNLKKEFPFFNNHKNLIFLDNAATTQKPDSVLLGLIECYEHSCFPVGRARYHGAEQATALYETIRTSIATFLNASPSSICLINSATMASNIISQQYCPQMNENERILLCGDAHHSLVAPWVYNAKKHNIGIDWLQPDHVGNFDYDLLEKTITNKTRCIALPLISHSFGYHVDLARIKKLTAKHNHTIHTIVDATQAAATIPIDLSKGYADALFFGGHKCYGPWGTGVLYVAPELQKLLGDTPIIGGGSIQTMTQKNITTAAFPQSWEAGSINLADYYGLMKAVEWMQKYKITQTASTHYQELKTLLLDYLTTTQCVVISGSTSTSIISFYHPQHHANDIADHCNNHNICVRSGFLCADILHVTQKLPALVRISFAAYTTQQDIELLIIALKELKL